MTHTARRRATGCMPLIGESDLLHAVLHGALRAPRLVAVGLKLDQASRRLRYTLRRDLYGIVDWGLYEL